jgi:tetratricopeptide (TPR) repeat protein
MILRRANGYVCEVGSDVLDLALFHEHLNSARSTEAERRLSDAFTHYVDAVHLWSGAAGENLADGLASSPTFFALNVEFFGACMAARELASNSVESARVLPALRVACAIDVLHEPLHASLMLALEASGQRAEALTVFDSLRRRLADELGIDPGQNLQVAYRAVLGPSPSEIVVDQGADELVDDRTVTAEPYRVSDFQGRVAEIRLIRDFLEVGAGDRSAPPSALLITGPPGVGKTTTILEAIHGSSQRSPHLFANLHGFDAEPVSPLQTLRALLAQLQPGDDTPATLDEASAAWRSAVGDRALLIVLDNASMESQVRPVLAVDAPVKVVISSRRTLAGLESTARVVLDPLPLQDSVDLLSTLIPPQQRSASDLDVLAELCGHFPLALRIAGARIASRPKWTVEDFVGRLRDKGGRLGQLAAGDLAIERTFSHSYDALDPSSRRLFGSLALLHGRTFTAEMAAAIDDLDTRACRDRLDALGDLGLVEIGRGDRYRMHDLLRLYADNRLRAESADEEVVDRQRNLNRWILDQTSAAARVFPSSWTAIVRSTSSEEKMQRALDWLTAETSHWFGALQSAASLGDHRVVVDTTVDLSGISSEWLAFGQWKEVLALGAESAVQIGDDEAHVRLLVALVDAMCGGKSDPGQLAIAAGKALAAAESLGKGQWIAQARELVALDYLEREEFEASLREFRRAESEFALEGHESGLVGARARILGILARFDLVEAQATADEAMSYLDGLGPAVVELQPVSRMNVYNSAARINLTIGHYSKVLEISNRMLAVRPSFVDRGGYAARSLRHRGFALIGLERFDEARAALESALQHVGVYRPEWWALDIQNALDSMPSSTSP